MAASEGVASLFHGPTELTTIARNSEFKVMRIALITVAVVALLAGCGEKPTADGCSPSISYTGHEVKLPHPRMPTSCGLVLMNSNYCTYDGNGGFKGVTQEVSGVCVTMSAP